MVETTAVIDRSTQVLCRRAAMQPSRMPAGERDEDREAADDQRDRPSRGDEVVDRHRRFLEGDTEIAVQQLPDPVEVLPPDRARRGRT